MNYPTFYLGTHKPGWLATIDWRHGLIDDLDEVYLPNGEPFREIPPLFVSWRRLVERKRPIRARGRWALDSGAFTMITKFGRWTCSPADYAADARRWQLEIGNLDFAATQDWPCEDAALKASNRTIEEHQALTIRSFLELRDIEPEVPWIPVLQGRLVDDYLRHVDAYDKAGVPLDRLPLVGLGSMCRRQATKEADVVIRRVAAEGLSLHGFGLKFGGLLRASTALKSVDSTAWSFDARSRALRTGETTIGCTHKSCANCPRKAVQWWIAIRSVLERWPNSEYETMHGVDLPNYLPKPSPLSRERQGFLFREESS